jgi:preflagellin peptidase FlaK
VFSLETAPDLVRLLAVPVFGWTAWRDVKTRRVPNRVWLPLVGLGVLALALESWLVFTATTAMPVDPAVFFLQVTLSLGLIVPLAYGFWWFGGFGGADAKALITLAVLFPTFPTYLLGQFSLPLVGQVSGIALPVVEPTLGVFALTVLSNTVVAGIFYPLALTLRNAALGHVSKVMFFGRPIPVEGATTEYGRLLQTPEGFTRRGLDLDALRMYLRWRGTTLDALRADPETYRDPASLPADPNPPGDGSIPATDGGETPDDPVASAAADPSATAVGGVPDPDAPPTPEDLDDPWGAEAFLDDIEGSAYGTTPEQLRGGLAVLAAEDEVWLTPGIPFLVPMFVGLLVGLTYGDVLFALLGATGLA